MAKPDILSRLERDEELCTRGCHEAPQTYTQDGQEPPQTCIGDGQEPPQMHLRDGQESLQTESCIQDGQESPERGIRESQEPPQPCIQDSQEPPQPCVRDSQEPPQPCTQDSQEPPQPSIRGGQEPPQAPADVEQVEEDLGDDVEVEDAEDDMGKLHGCQQDVAVPGPCFLPSLSVLERSCAEVLLAALANCPWNDLNLISERNIYAWPDESWGDNRQNLPEGAGMEPGAVGQTPWDLFQLLSMKARQKKQETLERCRQAQREPKAELCLRALSCWN